jgi:hypothetical protein
VNEYITGKRAMRSVNVSNLTETSDVAGALQTPVLLGNFFFYISTSAVLVVGHIRTGTGHSKCM